MIGRILRILNPFPYFNYFNNASETNEDGLYYSNESIRRELTNKDNYIKFLSDKNGQIKEENYKVKENNIKLNDEIKDLKANLKGYVEEKEHWEREKQGLIAKLRKRDN